ncbi:transcription factor Spi-C-like isoform X4 [Heterodontus francisci]|uniref:transcription factor Spi-C-like isoform X4 n=1 Tax=Heterodontus francisci TaxID=7792 RepID=UPI00355B53E2
MKEQRYMSKSGCYRSRCCILSMSCCMQDNYTPLFNDAFEVIHRQQHQHPSSQFRQEPSFQYLPSKSFTLDVHLPALSGERACSLLRPGCSVPTLAGRCKKRLRLYEFLSESLHDSEMSDCIQWVDRNSGVFQFISKNKEKVAEMWGRRKGNRKTMTYQKMARALRNYSRTGEIVKVRRKLTYQFDAQVLQRLGTSSSSHYPHINHERYGCDQWHFGYNYNDLLQENSI